MSWIRVSENSQPLGIDQLMASILIIVLCHGTLQRLVLPDLATSTHPTVRARSQRREQFGITDWHQAVERGRTAVSPPCCLTPDGPDEQIEVPQ